MVVEYALKGKQRKELANAVGEILKQEVSYTGVPKCEYHIGTFTVTKEGQLVSEDEEKLVELMNALKEKGFEASSSDRLEISMPRDILDDEGLEKLQTLIEAKGTLLKHAFKTESLELKIDEEKITFPWFMVPENPDKTNAYMLFVQAICKMAKEQKRILNKERDIENEKYAFRCFLLRLGFIGKHYKGARKVLLENLNGSAAFRDGRKKEETAC